MRNKTKAKGGWKLCSPLSALVRPAQKFVVGILSADSTDDRTGTPAFLMSGIMSDRISETACCDGCGNSIASRDRGVNRDGGSIHSAICQELVSRRGRGHNEARKGSPDDDGQLHSDRFLELWCVRRSMYCVS